MDRANGIRKSNFTASTSVPADSATFDFVYQNTNYKITYGNFLANLGVTGSIVPSSANGVSVLDKAGTVNTIRNIVAGNGLVATTNGTNDIALSSGLQQDGSGVAIINDISTANPKAVSLVAGSGIQIAADTGADTVTITATGALPSTKKVVVNSVSDFPAAVSGVITLEAGTVYEIANDINLTDRLVFSTNTSLVGKSIVAPQLTISNASAAITITDTDFYIADLKVENTIGDIFNITDTVGGTYVGRINNILIEGGAAIGTFDDLRGLGLSQFGARNMTQGMTFTGSNWNNLNIDRATLQSTDAAFVGIDLGTAVFNSLSISNPFIINPTAGSVGIDGAASGANLSAGNIGSISGSNFVGAITALGASFDVVDSPAWASIGNDDIADTLQDCLLSLPNSSGPYTVTISAATTPVLLDTGANPWVVERNSHFTGTTAGRATYNGRKNLVVSVVISASFAPASGTNKVLAMYLAKNGSVIANSERTVTVSSGSPKSITIPWQLELAPNDYLEVFVENETDTTNIVVNDAIFQVN